MKNLLASIIATTCLAGAASAQDWSGPYAGLSYGFHSGEQCYSGCPDYEFLGEDISIFGGYNLQNGAWVYGGEISVSVGGSAYEKDAFSTDEYEEYNYSGFIDLKGRVGYTVGDALLYGFVGYSFADWSEDGTPYSGDGMNFGAGADYRFGDQYFVGLEYISRDLPSDYPFEATVNTISIRGGMTF